MKLRCLTALAMIFVGVSFLSAQEHKPFPATDVLDTLACEAGSDFYIPIRLSHTSATALQFELEYDPDVLMLLQGSAASALTESGKSLSVHHLRRGLARVVIFGANLDPLPQGEIGGIVLQALTSQSATSVRAGRRSMPSIDGSALKSVVRNGHIIALSKEVSHEQK